MSGWAADGMNEDWSSQEFWRQLAPSLHIEDAEYLRGASILQVSTEIGTSLKELMRVEGYFQLPPPQWGMPLDDMAALVALLDARAIPAPFAFLFDEFWLLFAKLAPLVETQLGDGFFMLPDFWVWFVDPKRDDRGWSPHRDKGYQALRSDGSPKSVTVWLPLTEANTLNGCMYLVPADRDPTYGTPQDGEWKFAHADIRALPARPGSILMWNQAVLHWGSHTNSRETRPRISAAFEFQAGDVPAFNQPLLDPRKVPAFPFRLKLIAKQILQYQHMYALAPEIRQRAEQILQA